MKKVVLALMLVGCQVFAQEKKNDTIVTYYDGNHKIVDLEKLKDTDEIVLPIYVEKYFYHTGEGKYIGIRCRKEDPTAALDIKPILTLEF